MLTVKGLRKKYGKKVAIKDINLEIGEGEVVGIFGPNGSGKSTFMRILSGLISVSGGHVDLFGTVPSTLSKDKVSYLSETNNLPKNEKLMVVIQSYELFFDDFDKELCLRLLDAMTIGQEIESRVKNLSKGSLQKFRLALTMSRKAGLYLLDEPLGGIDPIAREDIIDTLVDTMLDGATMIITTHLVAEVEQILSRAIFINDGLILGDYQCDTLRFESNISVDQKYKEVLRNA